uniref:Uncharacterized protein n=1 Tax=Biomphalaria glabrata TaxID=6526 RepID=A0A2C9M2W0_BIOGL
MSSPRKRKIANPNLRKNRNNIKLVGKLGTYARPFIQRMVNSMRLKSYQSTMKTKHAFFSMLIMAMRKNKVCQIFYLLQSQRHLKNSKQILQTESLRRLPNMQESHTGKQKKKRSALNHHHHPPHAPKWPWGAGFSQMPPPGAVPPYIPHSFPPFQPPHSFPGFHGPGSTASVPPYQPTPFPGFPTPGPTSSAPPIFPCVPPPPPLFTERGSGNENEALYSMLISWYMSGYHTGYFQGLRQSPQNSPGHRTHR